MLAAAVSTATTPPPTPELGGLFGIALQLVQAMGEVGIGLLIIIETIFPPIPSEVVLTLAGFQVQLGQLNLVLTLAFATAGSIVGALVLYWLGKVLGRERSIRLLSKLPLVDREDFEKAAGWFDRHGRSAVFFGRLIPGVRSLISLPAGAAGMPLWSFLLFTTAGSLLWNTLLVAFGMIVGTQYAAIDQYSQWLDYALYTAIAALLAWLIIRRIVRWRRSRR